ncbi:MAG: hypothetical protein QOF63_2616, partial [Thermoanaerobaculia bacterium]|nr:hypothetical protein [Thermoanaerobaculia bacterium]
MCEPAWRLSRAFPRMGFKIADDQTPRLKLNAMERWRLAGWPGVRPAAYPAEPNILPSTAAART